MSILLYCPLESYPDRYSTQLVAWHERNWKSAQVPYIKIGAKPGTTSELVKGGIAYSAERRFEQSASQVLSILKTFPKPEEDHVILFDEFWSPGIEMIPFAYHLAKKPKPRMYATLWAQSVDIYDFTYEMRHWIRNFEKGIANILDGIFVATPYLKHLVCKYLEVDSTKVHAVGHPFDSEEVKNRMSWREPRENKVIFSSRWDWEKRPEFFLSVVREVLEKRPNIKFVITTSQAQLRSNCDPDLNSLITAIHQHGGKLLLAEGLTKEAYYRELTTAKIIFNCALQDWISYGLLEASCAGCYPVYPEFRSFKEVLCGLPEFLYDTHYPSKAAQMIIEHIDKDHWTPEAIDNRQWIHSRFDTTWLRMLEIMQIEHKWSDIFYPDEKDLWNDLDICERYEMDRNESTEVD